MSASRTSTLLGNPNVFNMGVPVTLAAIPADADNTSACGSTSAGLGQTLSVTWAVVSRPAASGAALASPSPNAAASYTTTFTPDDRLGIWVPSVFREQYEFSGPARSREEPVPQHEKILCEATYTNFRRFATSARIK